MLKQQEPVLAARGMRATHFVQPLRLYPLHVRLIQGLTHLRIIFGLQFLKCYPVETIRPREALL